VNCIASLGVTSNGSNPDAGPYGVTFLGAKPARLARSAGATPLHLVLLINYLVVHGDDGSSRNRWAVRTTGWTYRIELHDGRKSFAYHWHPVGRSAVTWPHVHVYGRTEPEELRKAHLPTGDVSLAALVRMLIDDFGVVPLRADWQAVLARHEDRPH